uniref:Uncharacterized protein n=1 Tax=Physcomitrium patens TaxID=3218 RepID=A0A7I4AHI4_PHYPA
MPRKKQKFAVPDDPSSTETAAQPATRSRARHITRSSAPAPHVSVTPTKQSTILFSAASTHRDEEVGKERRVMGASLTTNVLALTDTLGIKRGFHVDADQLLFLDTVRVMSVVPDVAVVPAKDVYEKILSGIQETKSLWVIVASYRLLHDLDLRHPQVTLKATGAGKSKVYELVDNKEQVWSPFKFATQKANEKPFTRVTTDLYSLLENIADELDGRQESKKKGDFGVDSASKNEDPLNRLVQFLMLRWLVSLFESDLRVRHQAFQGNPENSELVQESLIFRFLMGQKNVKIKELITNLLRLIARVDKLDDLNDGIPELRGQPERPDSGVDPTTSLLPSASSSPVFSVTDADFAHLAATFLSMILELEDFKALSDSKFGAARRSVSIWSPVEILMGILQYWKVYLCPLLQTLENPQLKFNLILKYLVTHAPGNTKKQLREISTPKNLFDCVSNVNLHKSFDPHVLQVLLAGAFQEM